MLDGFQNKEAESRACITPLVGRVFKDMFEEPSKRNILSKTSPHWSEERKRKVTPLG